jgi:hypothetical protein
MLASRHDFRVESEHNWTTCAAGEIFSPITVHCQETA